MSVVKAISAKPSAIGIEEFGQEIDVVDVIAVVIRARLKAEPAPHLNAAVAHLDFGPAPDLAHPRDGGGGHFLRPAKQQFERNWPHLFGEFGEADEPGRFAEHDIEAILLQPSINFDRVHLTEDLRKRAGMLQSLMEQQARNPNREVKPVGHPVPARDPHEA